MNVEKFAAPLFAAGVMMMSGCVNLEKPVLRIGIVSDNQAYPFDYDWGMDNMDKALAMLAEKKPEVILTAGDIADDSTAETLVCTAKLIKKHFPVMPQLAGCAGNHDYWITGPIESRTPEKTYAEFARSLGLPPDNPCHTVIKGYHFISMSEDVDFLQRTEYSDAALAKLEAEIQKAVAADPEKPVFVITHYPPVNTIAGSSGKSGQRAMHEMMKKYPQVFSLSGHTHYPLEDERSIWQGEYTALSLSTLAYGCMGGMYNSCNGILPFAREVNQMLYMEIFTDKLVIRRYNVSDKREIKPDAPWVVPLPFDPATAPYTAARSKQRTAPEFPADAKVLLRYDYGFMYIIFEAAKHEDFVHHYRLKITDLDKNEVVFDQNYAGDFYRWERNRADRMFFRLPGEVLVPGTNYRYEVFPVESFGNEGKPLVLEAPVRARYRFRQNVNIYPQE